MRIEVLEVVQHLEGLVVVGLAGLKMRRPREKVVAFWPADGSPFLQSRLQLQRCPKPPSDRYPDREHVSMVAACIKTPGTKHSQEDSDAAATSVGG